MKRLLIAVAVFAMAAALYVIVSTGRGGGTKFTPHAALAPTHHATPATSHQHQQATRPSPRIPVARTAPPPSATTKTAPAPSRNTGPTITAPRTDCRWRRYRDGAIGSDRRCAPGALDPAVSGHTAQTICSNAWLAGANRQQLPPFTRDKLMIEYQLPGNPVLYVAARVIPVEDGGSPTSPRNLYPLPLNGWGGEKTQAGVADQLHHQICSHKTTVAQAAHTLEGDWLSEGVPAD